MLTDTPRYRAAWAVERPRRACSALIRVPVGVACIGRTLGRPGGLFVVIGAPDEVKDSGSRKGCENGQDHLMSSKGLHALT